MQRTWPLITKQILQSKTEPAAWRSRVQFIFIYLNIHTWIRIPSHCVISNTNTIVSSYFEYEYDYFHLFWIWICIHALPGLSPSDLRILRRPFWFRAICRAIFEPKLIPLVVLCLLAALKILRSFEQFELLTCVYWHKPHIRIVLSSFWTVHQLDNEHNFM